MVRYEVTMVACPVVEVRSTGRQAIEQYDYDVWNALIGEAAAQGWEPYAVEDQICFLRRVLKDKFYAPQVTPLPGPSETMTKDGQHD